MSEADDELLPVPSREAWIYVLWDANREALYVGQAIRLHPLVRIDDHSYKSPWWNEVVFYSARRVELDDVNVAEYRTIRELHPKHNRVGNASCGTLKGYKTHLAFGEPTCEPCRQAANAYARERRRAKGIGPPKQAQCGTYAGYFAHLDRGEATCDACREANRAHHAERRRKRRESPPQKAQCGTYSGYVAHHRRGEASCGPCQEARREYRRQYKEKAELEKAWQRELRIVNAQPETSTRVP
jgi:hypothetical protein